MKRYSESWTNLELALMGGLRAASIPKKRKARLESLNSSTFLNSSISHINSSLFMSSSFQLSPSLSVHGLDVEMIQRLHKAKCADLKIHSHTNQLKRFVLYLMKHFKNRMIDMHKMGIGFCTVAVLTDIIKDSNFTKIDLSGNNLKDAGALEMVKAILVNPEILYLNISSNGITPEGASQILKALNFYEGLISLDISTSDFQNRNRLGLVGAKALYELLKYSKCLAILNIGGTSLGNKELREILDGVSQSNSLVSLGLSNNSFTSKHASVLVNVVMKSHIEVLNLSGNLLNNEFCEHLSDMLKGSKFRNCKIKKLDVSQCQISATGGSKLFSGILHNISMQSFNIARNPLGSAIAQALGVCLSNNRGLQWLNLYGCGLTDVICSKFVDIFKLNNSLKNINIGKNNITKKGAVPISLGLKQNYTLSHFDISENPIGKQGGSLIVKSIQNHMMIESFSMRECNLKDEVALLIIETAKNKSLLSTINIDLNQISPQYLVSLSNQLRTNRLNNQKASVPYILDRIMRTRISKDAMSYVDTRMKEMKKAKFEEENRVKRLVRKMAEIKAENFREYKLVHEEYTTVHEELMRKQNILQHKEFKVKNSKMKYIQQINQFKSNIKSTEEIIDGLIYKRSIIASQIEQFRADLLYQQAIVNEDLTDALVKLKIAENELRKSKLEMKAIRTEFIRRKHMNDLEMERLRRKKA